MVLISKDPVAVPSSKGGNKFPSLGLACSFLSGTGILFGSSPGHAAIIYSGVKNISYPLPADFNQSSGLVVDDISGEQFAFGWTFYETGSPPVAGQPLSAGLGSTTSGSGLGFAYSGKAGYSSAVGLASSYAFGDSIGPASYKENPFPVALFAYNTSTEAFQGNWALGTTAFAGGRFDTGSGYLYGWLRITTPSTLNVGEPLTLVDWAFETELDTPILAGGGVSSPVPAPLPALGAAAAMAASRRLRRRINSAQASDSPSQAMDQTC